MTKHEMPLFMKMSFESLGAQLGSWQFLRLAPPLKGMQIAPASQILSTSCSLLLPEVGHGLFGASDLVGFQGVGARPHGGLLGGGPLAAPNLSRHHPSCYG